MKSKNDSEMPRVFKTVYEKLEKRWIKPKFHIMDNEASSTVMSWLERNKVDTQKVSLHNHWSNTAERMIDTAKHHFISGMAGTDENYPIREWDRGLAQSQRTLNMLRPCRINPKLSADAFLEGQHDTNLTFSRKNNHTLWHQKKYKMDMAFQGILTPSPMNSNKCYISWVVKTPTKTLHHVLHSGMPTY